MKKGVFAIGTAIAVVAMIVMTGYALAAGMDRNETVQCLMWQKQAQEYKNFYLLQWQRDQCNFHKIPVGAYVKT